MYVKLGFAIAVHVDPDILLVDEVLAVGDEAFQRKCLNKIEQFQRAGRTILFVTHSLDLVEKLCTRGVVLDHGKVVYDGDPAFAVGTLRKILGTERPPPARPAGPEIGSCTPRRPGRRAAAAVDRLPPGRPPGRVRGARRRWRTRRRQGRRHGRR